VLQRRQLPVLLPRPQERLQEPKRLPRQERQPLLVRLPGQ